MSKRTLEDVIGDRYWVMTEEDVKCLWDAQREIERLRGIEKALLSIVSGVPAPRSTAITWLRQVAAAFQDENSVSCAWYNALADALEVKP